MLNIAFSYFTYLELYHIPVVWEHADTVRFCFIDYYNFQINELNKEWHECTIQ